MRSAVSPTAPSRPWWPRSKSKDVLRPSGSVSSLAYDDEKFPSTSTSSSISSKARDALPILKFNTLASAMGFKSKKLPALTIQDPPSPIAASHSYPTPNSSTRSRPGSGQSSTVVSPAPVDRTPFYTNRPPAKSVSTARSSDYDYDAASEPHSEPRTPSDHPRDRLSYQQSVMTFSEIDPFASGGIVVQHLQQDSNRLSVYSDSSVLDPHHKRLDLPPHRVSYASSSSNSHGAYSDNHALSPLSPLSPTSSFGKSPTASRSAHDLSQTNDAGYGTDGHFSSGSQRTRRMKTPSGSNSSTSTVTPNDYRSRLSEPPGTNGFHLPRKRSTPTLVRPRGMTVGVVDHRPAPTSDNALNSVQPLQIRRKASDLSTPSSTSTPSPSPVTFSRSRTISTSTTAESPVSPMGSKRPAVIVRKASSSRLPPPLPAPPTDLPPPPVPYSPYDKSPLEFRASSSSSSLNFAPSVDLHDLDTVDAIAQLMSGSYDLDLCDGRERDRQKGRSRGYRNAYIHDGDVSPIETEGELKLQYSLSKFPPVPTLTHGETSHPKAGKMLLRKMSSQQNLTQRTSLASVTSSASGAHEDMNGHSHGHTSSPGTKTPRKQRSFHTSRVPLPPLPGLRASSGHGHSTTSGDTFSPISPISEPRRSSVTSPRKRLFSGSSTRRSTSSHGPTSPSGEEDKRSIFSFDSDIRPATSSGIEAITMTFGSAGGPLSLLTKSASMTAPSVWDEPHTLGEYGSKRVSQSEYVPQYIMSPAEQLKLAEKLADEEANGSIRECDSESEEQRKPKLDLQPGDFGLTYSAAPSAVRSRSNSVLSNQSTGTLAFGDKIAPGMSSILSSMPHAALSAPPPALARKITLVDPVRGPARSTSMLARAVNKPPTISARPSTAQGSLSLPASPSFAFAAPSSDSLSLSPSLPPPPRRKLSRHDLHEIDAGKRTSVVPLNPLSPPPMRSVRHHRQDSTDTATTTASSRPPSSFDRQKILQRRSLMKKPSFLDIEDEFDQSAEIGSDDDDFHIESPTLESSFLDMDRGKNSFDTVRSTDSAFFV